MRSDEILKCPKEDVLKYAGSFKLLELFFRISLFFILFPFHPSLADFRSFRMSLIKSEPPQCPVCYAEYEDVSLGEPNIPEKDRRRTLNLPCGHTICTSCFSNLTRDVCPVCIEPINLNTIYNRNYSLEGETLHLK